MKSIFFGIFLFISIDSFSQGNPPWRNPLKTAWSLDGITFFNESLFQDSSGVPCLVKWKGDTLACVFQWFRQPMNSPTWDEVAIKFSYDAGQSWTSPTPIHIDGFPLNYQRPFDPTLAVVSSDSLRIYFSSSNGLPAGSLDSIVNTYSAISADGINYNFELNARFDHPTKPVIDPSVIHFNGNWQYLSPAGAPQDGAFHCLSTNGLDFIQQVDYTSDNFHNWTGNFMLEDSSKLKFYGSGQLIWYNYSLDGFNWLGYTNTNVVGGDPTVLKLGEGNYLIVYVGPPFSTAIREEMIIGKQKQVYPNPFSEKINLFPDEEINSFYQLKNSIGQTIWSDNKIEQHDFSALKSGIYLLEVITQNKIQVIKLIKE